MQLRKAGDEGALAVAPSSSDCLLRHFCLAACSLSKDGTFSPSSRNKEYCSWNTFIIFLKINIPERQWRLLQ